MLDILISCFSILVLLMIHYLWNGKKHSPFYIFESVFAIFLCITALFFHPSQDILFWIGWCFLVLTALEDALDEEVSLFFIGISSIFFLFSNLQIKWILLSLFVFLFFIVLSKLSKETFIGEGDAYILFPICLSLKNIEDILSVLFVSTLIAIPVVIFFLLFTKKKQFPFVPFLIFSFSLLKSPWGMYPKTFFLLFSFLYGILLFLLLGRGLFFIFKKFF